MQFLFTVLYCGSLSLVLSAFFIHAQSTSQGSFEKKSTAIRQANHEARGARFVRSSQNKKNHKNLKSNTHFKKKYQALKTFSQVLHLVSKEHLYKMSPEELVHNSIQGMLSEIDPHSAFLTKEEFAQFTDRTYNRFAGVGIEMGYKKNKFLVLRVIKRSPAAKAGLKEGDRVVFVNGQAIDSFSLPDLQKELKGKVNSILKLSVKRKGKIFNFTLKRKKIRKENFFSKKLPNHILYVRIEEFSNRISAKVRRALKKQKRLEGFILDLRSNPGGLLAEAVQVSNLFLDQGVITSVRGRRQALTEVIRANNLEHFKGFPILILVNEYSASASEIVASALQDNNRALVMGTRTFGKGTVQSIIPLDSGAAAKITVAQYYTPKNVSIQAHGVTPNIKIDPINFESIKNKERTVTTREENIRGHIKAAPQTQQELAVSFWGDFKKKNKKRDILSQDFQVFQAYNYIKILSYNNKHK